LFVVAGQAIMDSSSSASIKSSNKRPSKSLRRACWECKTTIPNERIEETTVY
jgi:hypothetical protein